MSRPTNLAHELPTLNQRIGSELPNVIALASNSPNRAAGLDVFVTPSDLTVSTLAASPAGGWSWWSDPRAVRHGSKTYFGYVRGDNGSVCVRSYDHLTATVSAESVVASGLIQDDHAAPAILVRASDSRILVFYSAGNTTSMFVKVSTNAEDISAFGAAITVHSIGTADDDLTYNMPIQLIGEANSPIYVFFRHRVDATSTYNWYYRKSTDGGATWGTTTHVVGISGRRPYLKVVRNGTSRIDFAVSDGHPISSSDVSLFHFYYEGGAYYKSDGNSAGSLPLDDTDMTTVYDGSTTGSWVQDVALDGTNPVMAYATFPGNDGSDHRANIAYWNGSAWTSRAIVAMGGAIIESPSLEAYYSGGIALDHDAPLERAWISREVSSQFELYRYTTTDDWATSTATAVTSGSASKNVRPVSVRGHGGDVAVMWMYGTYNDYIDYSVATRTTNAQIVAFGGSAATDDDDATYVTGTGNVVAQIDLGDEYRIVRSRLYVGTTSAGSRTFTLEGANEADFSDAVTLDTTTFTATGSLTGQQVLFNWDATDEYRYYRITDPTLETRRVYSWELYEASLASGSHDHDELYEPLGTVATHTGDTSDAHDASAISIADAGGYFIGTDAEAALQELGASSGASATRIWRPVMDGAGNVITDSGTGEAIMAFGPA